MRLPQRTRRNLSAVTTPALERMVNRLNLAVTKLRNAGATNVGPLLDGIADCEAELVDRIIREGRERESGKDEPERRADMLHVGFSVAGDGRRILFGEVRG
jgi:hypothetical protein